MRDKLNITHRKVKGKTIIDVKTDDELKNEKAMKEFLNDVAISTFIGIVIAAIAANIFALIYLT